ncbi:putative HupE / UreJ protein|nr:putative HupE / UreJ protein [Candidatus Pantoea persica]
MKAVLPLLLILVAAPALAHNGHGPESFGAGLLHPLTALDHLLMLSGAGVLAALVLLNVKTLPAPPRQALAAIVRQPGFARMVFCGALT